MPIVVNIFIMIFLKTVILKNSIPQKNQLISIVPEIIYNPQINEDIKNGEVICIKLLDYKITFNQFFRAYFKFGYFFVLMILKLTINFLLLTSCFILSIKS